MDIHKPQDSTEKQKKKEPTLMSSIELKDKLRSDLRSGKIVFDGDTSKIYKYLAQENFPKDDVWKTKVGDIKNQLSIDDINSLTQNVEASKIQAKNTLLHVFKTKYKTTSSAQEKIKQHLQEKSIDELEKTIANISGEQLLLLSKDIKLTQGVDFEHPKKSADTAVAKLEGELKTIRQTANGHKQTQIDNIIGFLNRRQPTAIKNNTHLLEAIRQLGLNDAQFSALWSHMSNLVPSVSLGELLARISNASEQTALIAYAKNLGFTEEGDVSWEDLLSDVEISLQDPKILSIIKNKSQQYLLQLGFSQLQIHARAYDEEKAETLYDGDGAIDKLISLGVFSDADKANIEQAGSVIALPDGNGWTVYWEITEPQITHVRHTAKIKVRVLGHNGLYTEPSAVVERDYDKWYIEIASAYLNSSELQKPQIYNIGQWKQYKEELNTSVPGISEKMSKWELIEELNTLDTNGEKYNTLNDMCFTIDEDSWKAAVFRVIEKGDTLVVEEADGTLSEPITPYEFFSTFAYYKEQNGGKTKRIPSVFSKESALEKLRSHSDKNVKEGFESIEIRNNSFQLRHKKEDHPQGIEYFKGPDEKTLKVAQISDNYVEIELGELKEPTDGKNGQFTAKSKAKITWTAFYDLIGSVYKQPYTDLAQAIEDNIPDAGVKGKGFFGRLKFWKGALTPMALYQGVKMPFEAYKRSIENKTNVQARKMALGLMQKSKLDWFLGYDTELELQGQVVQDTKKQVQELAEKIEGLPGRTQGKMVKKIANDPHAQDYEIIAAIMAMAMQHGTLYTHDMSSKIGTYFWFQKLGGKIDSQIFKSWKKDADKTGNYNEVSLIQFYLKKKYTDDPAMAKMFVQVMKATMTANKDSIEKGEGEANLKSTYRWRADIAIGKLEWGEHAFFYGAMKKSLDKASTGKELLELPFTYAFTGMSGRASESIWNEMKNDLVFGKGMVISPLILGTSPHNIDLLQRVTLKLAKKISPHAEKEAEEIIKLSKDPGKTETCVKKTTVFWKKYGSELSGMLEMTKNPYLFLEKEKDADYKEFYDKVTAFKNNSDIKTNSDLIENGLYEYIGGMSERLAKMVTGGKSSTESGQAGKQIGDNLSALAKNIEQTYKEENLSEAEKKEKIKAVFQFHAKMIYGRVQKNNNEADFMKKHLTRTLIQNFGFFSGLEKKEKEVAAKNYTHSPEQVTRTAVLEMAKAEEQQQNIEADFESFYDKFILGKNTSNTIATRIQSQTEKVIDPKGWSILKSNKKKDDTEEQFAIGA